MAASMEIVLSLLEVFIMIIPGFILARKSVISEEQVNGISTVVVNLTWPCLIIASLQMEPSLEIIRNAAIVVLAMCAIIAVSYALAFLIKKAAGLEQSRSYLFTYMLIFANTGFMGIPVAQALYGREGVFYIALADSFSDIFVFTIGIILMQKATGRIVKTDYKELISPGMISIVIGVILFLTGTTLPSIIGTPIATIGSATTPLAMLIVGYQLGKADLKDLFTDKEGYLLAAAKLILLPAIVLIGMNLLLGDLSVFIKVVVLIAALPTATCSIIFAGKYQGDTVYTAKGVVLTTVLSVITIPIVAVLLELG